MSKHLSISLIIVALIIGIGIGYAISPSYGQMREEKEISMMNLGEADRNLDKRFINGMIAHHQAAIFLANQAKDSHRTEIRELANTIVTVDEKGISDLYALKEELYDDNSKVSDFNKVNLGTVDDQFDLRFLNALIAHHDEAIFVAQDVQTKSTRSSILTLASEVVRGLSDGLITLKGWRADWYGI